MPIMSNSTGRGEPESLVRVEDNFGVILPIIETLISFFKFENAGETKKENYPRPPIEKI